MMEMKSVSSSQISAYGYDEADRTLAIEFKDGGLYHYFEVAPDVAQAMGTAQSVGSFFHREIRAHYRYQKIMPVQPIEGTDNT